MICDLADKIIYTECIFQRLNKYDIFRSNFVVEKEEAEYEFRYCKRSNKKQSSIRKSD